MKTKRVLILFITVFIITLASCCQYTVLRLLGDYTGIMGAFIYDGLYYLVLILLGILTMKFADENYRFIRASFGIGFVFLVSSIIIMVFMEDGQKKDILFAITSFMPVLVIMNYITEDIFNHILSWKSVEKSGAIEVIGVIILLISALSVYALHLPLYIVLYYALLYFYGAYTKRVVVSEKVRLLFMGFFVASVLYIYGSKIVFSLKDMNITNMGYETYIVATMYVMWLAVGGISEITGKSKLWQWLNKKGVIYRKPKHKELKETAYYNTIKNHIYSTVFIFALICGIEAFIRFMAMGSVSSDTLLNVLSYFVSGTFFYNLFMLYCIVNLIYAVFGKNITFIAVCLSVAVYVVANGIKLHFHNSVFKFMDFLLVREMLLMAKRYIGIPGIMLIILAVVFVVGFVAIFRKKIVKLLKPVPRKGYTVAMLALTIFCIYLVKADFVKVTKNSEESSQTEKYMNEGVFLYNYDSLSESKETLFPDKPKDYTKENMERIKKEGQRYKAVVSDIKPDVIVLTIESYFDINAVKEIKLNRDVLPVYRKYGRGNIISPYYGGESAAVQFEMMTGLTNYYMLEGIIPYTIYFDENKKFPGIVNEFKANGYETSVVHPIQEAFYNNGNAYKSLGVDYFYSSEALDKTTPVGTDYTLDKFVGDKIIDIASENSKPQFILGVTLEEHSPYSDKYDRDELTVSAEVTDRLDRDDADEIEQYSQAISNGGDMIQRVIDYIDSTDRPTLLYVFGDHLPPLSALKETSVLANKWQKYETPLITYSNYKDIDFNMDNVKITPNQLAPQILRDAEIKHNSYFDYIYGLREEYPIIHKEFLNNDDNKALRDYYLIQYDIIFGEKYLINQE